MEDNKKPWKTTCNRFVAFFVIAGTKDRIKKRSANDIYEQLIKVTKVPDWITEKYPETKEHVYYSAFSDSLIFISKDDSKESLTTFLDIVTFAFASSIKQCLPLKGAISHGEMTADKDNKIFFGQPLIDAFLIQDTILDYYGAIYDNKFKEKISTINMTLDSWIFDYISFWKTDEESEKDKKTKPREYFDLTSWHLDWFRVLRSLNGYNINKVDLAALNNADNKIDEYIKKLYTGDREKIKLCLDNTLKVFGYNKQKAVEFMKDVELLYKINTNGKEE